MKKNYTWRMIGIFVLLLLAACNSSNENTGAEPNSESDESVIISLGHINPETEDAQFHQGILKFVEIVDEKTNGSVKFDIHPGGELGGEREMIEATQLGTLDMVVTSNGPLGNFADKTFAFDFPFLFRDRDHAYKVLDGEIGDEINEQIEETGVYNLAWWETGYRQISNNKQPITKPEDLKGLKIRTMENPIHLSTFEAYGASPTPMAFTELYTGLEQGVVDGQENPFTVIVPNKLQEVQKYLTVSNHFYTPGAVLINQAKFDGLSPELQQIIQDAAIEARDYEREFIQQLDAKLIQVMEESGTEVTDQFDFDAFFEASQGVYEQYADQYGELLDKILAVQ
ncbi:TRAP transporter substrate-binding protein [Halalkalibacter oceani]|uniref:TRAP transporter substrate-binding protein n=1 Tax=Halalkalibacter oceani TaxID=1653776 RepID=UPI00339A6E37